MAKTIRVLHVIGNMNRGGIETWLMHALRHLDRQQIQMDFLVHSTKPCAYGDEIKALGSQIIPCLYPSKPLLYASNFKKILKDYGPYDIIHSHVEHFSGYVLFLAKMFGIPTRIAHSHNDTTRLDAKAGLFRRGYLNLMKHFITQSATVGLAASRQAAVALFGLAWEKDPRWRLLYYSINLAPFQERVDRAAIRAELNIPPDAFVIGHVGRFSEQKNHPFLIDIFAEISKRESEIYFLLVGDGQLRPAIEQKVVSLGLANRTIFAGLRPDVFRLMLGAMDIFVLPSHHEGLPVVGLEAQAAGLPLIIADNITEELDGIKPLVQRISLSQAASSWAKTILETKRNKAAISQLEALAILEKSSFNIVSGLQSLKRIYEGEY